MVPGGRGGMIPMEIGIWENHQTVFCEFFLLMAIDRCGIIGV